MMQKFYSLNTFLAVAIIFCLHFSLAQAYPDMAGVEPPGSLEFKSADPPPPTDDYNQMPGFPKQMGTGMFSPCEGPILVDIDGDGNQEVFAGGGDGNLYGWHHDGTSVAGFPVYTGNAIQSSPTVGDIDGDSDLEILICNRALSSTIGDVYAFHHTGALVSGWPQHTNHGMGINSVGLWDFDNDGVFEVFVGSDRLYVWRGNGTLVPGFPANFSGSQYGTCSASSAGDIDGDGDAEIILEGWDYLNAFHHNGTMVQGFPYQLPGGQGFSYSAPSLADIDNDGNVEIFCASHGSPNSYLYGLNGDGTSLPGFPQSITGWTYSTPALGDLDGDGQVEVALLCNSGVLYAFNTDGTPVANWPVFMGQYNCEAALAIADLDNNNQLDVFFGNNGGTPNPQYFGYRADGSLHPDFPFSTGGAALPSGSAIADADNNGTLEIAYHVSTGLVYLWTSPYQAANAARPWAQPHHDVQHTGNYNFAEAHEVTITMIPVGPPPITPPFQFNVTVANNEHVPVNCDAWIMVRLPNGAWYGPVLGPIALTLPGSTSVTRLRTQNVPASAPAGTYWYEGRVGDYPSVVWDTSGFAFVKLATDAGESSLSEWLSVDETFTPTQVRLNIYPNPFNPSTLISYELRAASFVSLRVYDTAGRLVSTLVNGHREAGEHQVTFDGSTLASGLYLYQLNSAGQTLTGKMVLVK